MLAEAVKLGNVTSNVRIFRDREGGFIWRKKKEFCIICVASFKENISNL